LHTTVTVPAFLEGKELIFHVLGTDSRGQNSATQVVGYVEGSPRWTEIVSRGSQLLDYDDQRVLYQGADGSTYLANRAGGGEVLLRGPIPFLSPYGRIGSGWLHPQGALFTSSGLYDLRNGTVQALSGYATGVAGNWLILRDGGTNGGTAGSLFRRDLALGTMQLVGRANDQHVAANGDVVYSSEDWDILRYRGGVTTRLTPVSDLRNAYPVTDGINVVFLRTPIFINTNGAQIILITPTGAEVVLAPSNFLQTPMVPGQDYAVNGGWTAFTRVVNNSVKQVWVRSPSSVLYQITDGTATRLVRSLGPNGELVYSGTTGRMYLVLPPYTAAPVDVGAWYPGTVFEWRNGQLVAFLGRSAFTISY
ncbi:MAG TPA: hypothetical protein VGX50_08960, partial [Longimicrobium sp.]|nr:hypothetical protein [Longimicrobium sp.]